MFYNFDFVDIIILCYLGLFKKARRNEMITMGGCLLNKKAIGTDDGALPFMCRVEMMCSPLVRNVIKNLNLEEKLPNHCQFHS